MIPKPKIIIYVECKKNKFSKNKGRGGEGGI
jgi:hypothetical protein